MRHPLLQNSWAVALLSALTAFLLLIPLVVGKPGLPQVLKGDEPGYYLGALSFAYDFDARLDLADVDRAFDEYGFTRMGNVIVGTDDGWQTAYYAKPYLYSLLAAPFARLFGANGLVFFNMALFLAMVWMGALYLCRREATASSVLFAIGFFFAGAGASYIWWLQPEVLNMFGVAGAFYFGFRSSRAHASGEGPGTLALVLSGVLLAITVYNKPMFAPLALPLVGPLLLRRDFRSSLQWVGGHAAALVVFALVGLAFTGHPTAYVGMQQRFSATICEPGELPVQILTARAQFEEAQAKEQREALARVGAAEAPAPEVAMGASGSEVDGPATSPVAAEEASPLVAEESANTWGWLFRVPESTPRELLENIRYFLIGRHAGLFVYFPFVLIGLLSFLRHSPRDLARWLIVAGAAISALFFLLQIYWNWQGGGGFIGNRYFVNAVPAFLFLVAGVVRLRYIFLGFVAAAVLIGPLLISPFGTTVPEPTLQAHTRNVVLRNLPLELSLRNVPGYTKERFGDLRVTARKDAVVRQGDRLWVRARLPVEIIVESHVPLDRYRVDIESLVGGNTVRVAFGDDDQRLVLEKGAQQLLFEPGSGRRRTREGHVIYTYRLDVSAERGEIQHWVRHYPPTPCAYFAHNESQNESFYVGVVLKLAGLESELAAPVYDVHWGEASAPEQVAAGEEFDVRAFVGNASSSAWPNLGVGRVNLAYHWYDEEAREIVRDGVRTDLGGRLEAGQGRGVRMKVRAPEVPGRYELRLDPLLEHVSWFSQQGVATKNLWIEVAEPSELSGDEESDPESVEGE